MSQRGIWAARFGVRRGDDRHFRYSVLSAWRADTGWIPAKRDKAFREDSLMKQVSQVQSEKRKPWKNGRREPGKLCLGVRDWTLNSRRREFHTQARRRAEEDGEVLLAVAALRTVAVTAGPCPLDDGEEGWRWLGLALGARLLAAKQGPGKLDELFL